MKKDFENKFLELIEKNGIKIIAAIFKSFMKKKNVKKENKDL